ncbi:MAG: hypothetical protein SGI89_00985 [bacterium]|nr:hypothetical protein [bacterium]
MSDNNKNPDQDAPLKDENKSNPDKDGNYDLEPEQKAKLSSDEDKVKPKEEPGSEDQEDTVSITDKNTLSTDTNAANEKELNKEKEVTPETTPLISPVIQKQKPKESNYQISLIDENLLKVIVVSKKGVCINSVVKEETSSVETQTNEIYFNPKFDYGLQEIEVLIAIDAQEKLQGEPNVENEEAGEEFKDTPGQKTSNYQINLINENLLKVNIITDKGVRIESITRDKKISTQTQSNKIYLKPKSENEHQKIEITIAVDSKSKEEIIGVTEDGHVKLIPNPEVIDLIKPPDYSLFYNGDDEYIAGLPGYKNPFDALRKLIQKNLTIGIIAAIILHVSAAAFAFYTLSKRSKDQIIEEPQRLIIIQDLPDPKIKLEDVEDPNKPEVVEPPVAEPDDKELTKREITPRRIIQPPTVKRPNREKESREDETDTTLGSDMTKKLDSLRKLVDEVVGDDTTSATDTTEKVFDIVDSLRNNFNENDVGLSMYYPKSWILQDSRELNKNKTEFEGVVLIDTANGKGSMNFFIYLDKDNKEYKAEDFKKEFPMTDSTLTAFSMDPYTQAVTTYYKFYIFNKLGTEKLSLTAQIKQQFFEQYKNEIEAVVRSINIRKKDDL